MQVAISLLFLSCRSLAFMPAASIGRSSSWNTAASQRCNPNEDGRFVIISSSSATRFYSTTSDEDANNDEYEEHFEPGQMRVSEIKAELSMRNVAFGDCFDKDSLVQRLHEARASGKADPNIIDEFNKKKLEATMKGDTFIKPETITDDTVSAAVGGDGTLPGGMPPDMLKELVSNPELMELVQNPKMQEVMKLMMGQGQDAVQEAMADDPEMRQMVLKLNYIMENATK